MGESGMNFADLWPIGLMFVMFYFLLIRPQKKRQAQQKQMLEALSIDDEVITSSGIFGKVVKVSETAITIEIAEDVNIAVQKAAITTLLPRGTLASLDGAAPSDTLLPPPPPPSCCA